MTNEALLVRAIHGALLQHPDGRQTGKSVQKKAVSSAERLGSEVDGVVLCTRSCRTHTRCSA